MKELLPLALVTSSFASPVVLTLGNSSGENTVSVTATFNDLISDTATTVYSGTIELDLSYADTQVTSFEMTGGNIAASDSSFLFEAIPFFSQTLSFVDVQGTPTSPSGPEILGTPGSFSAAEHYILFNQGCIVSSGTLDESKTLVSETPFPAAGTGQGSITLDTPLNLLSSLTGEIIGTTYRVSLSLPLNSTQTNTDGDITLKTDTTGTVTASGTTTLFSHPFFEWATENAPEAGTAISFTADADRDGQADGISWALGFEAGASFKQLQPVINHDTNELTFVLPGPTRSELTLQQSTTLDPDDWTDVPGFSAIPAGHNEPIVVSLVSSQKRFYRFVTSLD